MIVCKILNIKNIYSVFGIKFYRNWNDWTFKFYISGYYGRFYSNYIKNIDYDFIFIDIGANQGLYSILAAKNSRCKKVYSFEPVSEIFLLLKKNALINNVSHKVGTFQLGISNRSTIIDIGITNGHSGASSIDSQKADKYEKIKLINSNEVSKLIKKDLPIIIKVDVEGHESTVIKDIINSNFFKNVRSIYYEILPNFEESSSLEKHLIKNGLKDIEYEGVGERPHFNVMAKKASS